MNIVWYTTKPVQGNISVIMLFVLAIGSLIGLMSTWFVQDMISSSSQIRDFYQSYYIARWGLELWTLAANRYEYGFEDIVSGSQNNIKNNLYCRKNCNLDVTIQSRIKPKNRESVTINNLLEPISECNFNTSNRFQLSPGQSYVLPLFADKRKLSEVTNSYDNIANILGQNPPYNISIKTTDQSLPLGIGVVLGSWNQAIYNMMDIQSQQKLFITGTIDQGSSTFNIFNFLTVGKGINATIAFGGQSINSQYTTPPNASHNDFFNYLYISNLSVDQIFSYCLDITASEYWFVSDKSIITAISTYGDTTLGLQAQSRKPLLEYIIRPNTDI